MKIKNFSLITVCLAASIGVARADIVTNGGFEDGFTGWSVTAFNNQDTNNLPQIIQYGQSSGFPTGAYGESIPAPVGGGQFGVYFSTDFALHSVAQNITLITGQQYVLSFDLYAPANGRANPFDAALNAFADNVDPLVHIDSVKDLANGWNHFSAVFTATNGLNLEFDFAGAGDNPGDYAADLVLDNVAVTGVPEVSTWLMLILGFIGVGGLSQLSRRDRKILDRCPAAPFSQTAA
jgi:hypothetical protein